MPPKKQKSAPNEPSLLAGLYDAMVKSGQIQDDAAQREVLATLSALSAELAKPRGTLGALFGKSGHKGLYIWGHVGRGKSMVMDLFFAHVAAPKKRRVHFHAFMQEVYARLHEIRQEGQSNKIGIDPVIRLAKELSAQVTLLCFDELQATDVADATLVYRLFSQLFDDGVTIVSTSNHPPASLYTGGVQRERFDRFIALIESHMRVMSLMSPFDYRYKQIQSFERRYVYPLGPAADAFIATALQRICTNSSPRKATITVQGRELQFTLYDKAIGRFTFAELCEMPLGAADYLAIAKRCDTLILTGIPKLPPEKRNEAKRFVTLVDSLYERKVKLLCTAAVPPEQIYKDGDGTFEFNRTVSRLIEMQSEHWGK